MQACNAQQPTRFSSSSASLALHRLRRPVNTKRSCLAVQEQHQPQQLISAVVNCPAAYTQQWRTATKPRLDALWSAALQTSNAERLLLTLDSLLMVLRSCRSLSVHLAQHHTDPAWAAAAEQVAADCSKYEKYVASNRAITCRLQTLHSSLRQQQQQQHADDSAQPASASILSLRQQLDLCSVTLQSLQAGGGGTQDSMQWLAALELPDANVERMQQLQAQERSITAAIDSVLSQPVTVELPATPEQLLQGAAAHDSNPTAPNTGSTLQTSSSADEVLISAQQPSAEPAEAQRHQQEQQQQAVVVAVTKGMLARLLQQCPDSAVREQLYCEVLQPKLQQATRLLGQLARCRAQQARLAGFDSYYSMTQQRLHATAAAGGSRTAGLGPPADEAHLGPLESLLSLHESLAPLCEQEVVRVSRQASTQPSLQQQQAEHAGRQCEAQVPAQPSSSVGQASAGDAAAGPTEHQQQQFVQQTGPWDWDYLLHKANLPYTTALKKGAAVLQQHLQLPGVVNGFSCQLQDLLGLQLLPRPAAAAAAAATGPTDVWASHVLVLDIVLQQQQQQQQHGQQQQPAPEVLGTVYVDIGGGYGARMLRYARSTSGVDGAAYELPAVAVGMSGARMTAPQHQQEQGTSAPEGSAGADASGSEASAGLVLSVAQLWELGHELGHAVHLVCSSRQPACHLSGRFLSPQLLELPPQLMERLLLQPGVLARVCTHAVSQQPLPGHLADALAAYYSSRYSSALAVSARVAVSLAECMYGQYGGDMEDHWRGSWEVVSGLPPSVAAAGSLREVSLLPVMAAHQGTYHAYLSAFKQAEQLYQEAVKPLLEADDLPAARQEELRALVWTVFSAHLGV